MECPKDIGQHVDKLVDCCTVASNIREKWKKNENRDKIVEWITKYQDVICRAINRKVYFELTFEGIDDVPDPEDFGEAFNRVNRLGVRLEGADMFFSAFKLKCPNAHDSVWSIYEDTHAGKLISPPQIVHAAVRLAIADHNKERPEAKIEDRLNLSLSDARNLLSTGSSISIKGRLEELIKPIGILQDLFQRFREKLEYKGKSDFGLPLPLLASFGARKPYILHNILLWLYRNPNLNNPPEGLRHRLVRYAIVDYFFLYANDDYRRKSFSECRQPGDFPDLELLELAVSLKLMNEAFKGKEPLLLALPYDFEDYTKDQQDPTNLNDLLLWAQRYYLHDRFPDYDPTLFFNVSALPWDRDHIWPQAKMDGRSIEIDEDAWKIRDKYKSLYLHSFGNLNGSSLARFVRYLLS